MPPDFVVLSGEDGLAELSGLAVAKAIVRVRAEGFALRRIELLDGPPGETLVVALEAGASVQGRVLLAEASELGACRVWAGVPGDDSDFDALAPSAAVDTGGNFTLEDVPLGRQRLWLETPQGAFPTDVDVPVEGLRDVVLAPPDRAKVRGRVVRASGPALASLRLVLQPPGAQAPLLQTFTDEAGAFEFSVPGNGPFELVAFAGEGLQTPVLRVEGVVPASEPLELVVPDDSLPSAYVTGRVTPPEPLFSVEIVAPDADVHTVGTANPDGTFRCGPLRAGRFWVRATAPRSAPVLSAPFEVAPGEEHDVGTLWLEPGGSLRIDPGTCDGAVRVWIEDEHGRKVREASSLSGEELEIGPQPGGRYTLHARRIPSNLSQDLVVTLVSGESLRVKLVW